jgi:hypothetical protein
VTIHGHVTLFRRSLRGSLPRGRDVIGQVGFKQSAVRHCGVTIADSSRFDFSRNSYLQHIRRYRLSSPDQGIRPFRRRSR